MKTREKEKINRPKNFADMSKKERKIFLSMDLIERMIRIEQKVSATFNKKLDYKNTEYYKELTDIERKAFEHYIKKQNRKKFLLGAFLAVPIVLFCLVSFDFTGNAIRETLDNEIVFGLMQKIITFIALAVCAVIFIIMFFKRQRKRRYDHHFWVLENALLGKRKLLHSSIKKQKTFK